MNFDSYKRFFNAYQTLSEMGACDTPGGHEYRRVLTEWIKAGKPEPAADFIRVGANVGPEAA